MKEISESIEINCRFCKSQDITNLDLNFIQCNECNCIFNQNFNELSEVKLKKSIEINLIAPMLLTKKVIGMMEENNRGHITDIASLLSHITGNLTTAN